MGPRLAAATLSVSLIMLAACDAGMRSPDDSTDSRPARPPSEPSERLEDVYPDPAVLEGLDERSRAFLALVVRVEGALDEVEATWGPGSAMKAMDAVRVIGALRSPGGRRLVEIMERREGVSFGVDTNAWYGWLWSREYAPDADYAAYKSAVFKWIDPRFGDYFDDDPVAEIRLDEVRWGGVPQDGIPPLRGPRMISADKAAYLEDTNVVFGIEINGDARAYPKRILAWHEMFVDTVGGVDVAGVYCTLCGTVIIYETTLADGRSFALGTSGFLYRSNKLMYDRETKSMWNTLWGVPVIGPLAEAEPAIELPRRAVVTTTWGEWRRRHPETTVLSPDTGHSRDYREGAAYAAYFATDELMFGVPEVDDRLLNKQEVLGLVWDGDPETAETLAIDTAFLVSNPVYQDRLAGRAFVVLTDASGANRVYESGGLTFAGYDGDSTARSDDGAAWTLTEAALRSDDGRTLERLPAQRAFWFGWSSAFENVRLVR